MSSLIHLIYTSAATIEFTESDLIELLNKARAKNSALGITGMLLFEKGSFFQILEGMPSAIDALYQTIEQDKRHKNVVTIIREPIVLRSFAEWTMGYSEISQNEISEITGLNDFFGQASIFQEVNSGRAKKLLNAFRDGRWRSKVSFTAQPMVIRDKKVIGPTNELPKVSFAYQPIVDSNLLEIVAYEAMITIQDSSTLLEMPAEGNAQKWAQFETSQQPKALQIAAQLNIDCDIFLKFKAHHIDAARDSMSQILSQANALNIAANRIIFEIDHEAMIGDFTKFAKIIEDFKAAGLKISIDHFGAGKAGLNLLEALNPDIVSLNAQLVRDIHQNGSRQAIVRGVLQTCNDLGIDLVAKFVESEDEYRWFHSEGIYMLQGNFISAPAYEQLPKAKFLAI